MNERAPVMAKIDEGMSSTPLQRGERRRQTKFPTKAHKQCGIPRLSAPVVPHLVLQPPLRRFQ